MDRDPKRLTVKETLETVAFSLVDKALVSVDWFFENFLSDKGTVDSYESHFMPDQFQRKWKEGRYSPLVDKKKE